MRDLHQPGIIGMRSVVLVVAGVVGASLSGPLMAAAVAVPALAVAFWRTGLGAVVMAAVGLVSRRGVIGSLSRSDLALTGVAGLMLAGHFATWATSLRMTSVAAATSLVVLQAGWVVVIERIRGISVARRVWLGLAVAFVGVVVITGVDVSLSTQAVFGDLLALAGGAFMGVYVVVGGRVRQHADTSTYTMLCYGVGAATLLVACLLGGVQLAGYPARGWALVGAVTFASQLMGHSVFNYLLATLSPTVVGMVLLLEVPGAALIAAAFLGQAPPFAVYVGLVVICVGLAVVVSGRERADVSAEAPMD